MVEKAEDSLNFRYRFLKAKEKQKAIQINGWLFYLTKLFLSELSDDFFDNTI